MALMHTPLILDEDKVTGKRPLGHWPRVLALDPGVTSGWAVVWFDPDVVFDQMQSIQRAPVAWQAGMWLGDENGQVDAHLMMLRRPDVGGEGVALVVEDFIPRAKFQDRDFLSPVRLTAGLKYGLHRGMVEADGVARRRKLPKECIQGASDAKNVITDQRLDTWHMYLKGPDHPRDATRHALLWIRRLRAGGETWYDKMHFVDVEEED